MRRLMNTKLMVILNFQSLSLNDQLLFETLKLQIRLFLMQHGRKLKEQNKTENFLEKEINSLQQSLNASPCEETKRKLTQKQNELQGLREHKMRGIATRSKANWITRGEKSTKYFLNLEKRHYTNKQIPKLVLEDATEITNQKDIIKEQERFYEKLYTSRETQLTLDHSTTFFNQDSIRSKWTHAEKDCCEANISAEECLYALKSMGDGKSPGMDGFIVEFYKFFLEEPVSLFSAVN